MIHEPQDRRGAVLVVVVLMCVALYAMAHGILLSTRHALGSARIGATLVEVRASADAELEATRRTGLGVWADSVPVGGIRSVVDALPAGDTARTSWRRLAAEAWLLSVAVERDHFPVVRSERLLWVYAPLERMRALRAPLSVGSSATVEGAGTVHALDVLAERADASPELTIACTRWWDDWAASVAAPSTALAFVETAALGPLGLDELVGRAAALAAPVGTPTPVEVAGVCDASDPWSWGDPDDPDGPCGASFAFRARTGPTLLTGGVGQGVLVIDGDLQLTSSARFYGVVIVSGRLRLTAGARVEGLAVALGGAELEEGSSLVGSVCRAGLALAGVRERLSVALPLHDAFRFGPRAVRP